MLMLSHASLLVGSTAFVFMVFVLAQIPWNITLVDTLFNLLDSLNVGALGSHEFAQFAALTGSQTDNALLQGQASSRHVGVHPRLPVLHQQDQHVVLQTGRLTRWAALYD